MNALEELEQRARVLAEVSRERDRQEQKWGDQSAALSRDRGRALAILMEEVGEAARAMLEGDADYRYELIQVAAVAVAMVQAVTE